MDAEFRQAFRRRESDLVRRGDEAAGRLAHPALQDRLAGGKAAVCLRGVQAVHFVLPVSDF